MWNLTEFFVYLHHMLSLLLGWIHDFSISIIRWFFCIWACFFFSFLSCYFIDCIFRCVVSGLSQNVSVQWKFSRVCRLLESVNRYSFYFTFFCVSIENGQEKLRIHSIFVHFFLTHFSGRSLSQYSVVDSRRMGIFEQQQVVILHTFSFQKKVLCAVERDFSLFTSVPIQYPLNCLVQFIHLKFAAATWISMECNIFLAFKVSWFCYLDFNGAQYTISFPLKVSWLVDCTSRWNIWTELW